MRAADWTVGSDFRSKGRHIASSSNEALTPLAPSHFPFPFPFGAGRTGRSEIGLMDSRVATDWAHRIPLRKQGRSKPSQNRTKESTQQSKFSFKRLREYLSKCTGHLSKVTRVGGGIVEIERWSGEASLLETLNPPEKFDATARNGRVFFERPVFVPFCTLQF